METPQLSKFGVIFVCIILYILYFIVSYMNTHPLRKIGITHTLYQENSYNYDDLIINELTYNLSEFFICYSEILGNEPNNVNEIEFKELTTIESFGNFQMPSFNQISENIHNSLNNFLLSFTSNDSPEDREIKLLLKKIYKLILYDKKYNFSKLQMEFTGIKKAFTGNTDEIDEKLEEMGIIEVFQALKNKSGILQELNENLLKSESNVDIIGTIVENDFKLLKYLVPVKKYNDDDPLFNKEINFSQSDNDINIKSMIEAANENPELTLLGLLTGATQGAAVIGIAGEVGQELQKVSNALMNLVLKIISGLSKFAYSSTIKGFADTNDDVLKYTTFLNVFINKEDQSMGFVMFKFIRILQEKINNILNNYTKINSIDGLKYFYKTNKNANDEKKKELIMKVLRIFYNLSINLQVYLLNVNKKYTISNLLALFGLDMIKETNNLDLTNKNTLNMEIEIKDRYKYYDISTETLNAIKQNEMTNKVSYFKQYSASEILDDIIDMSINANINMTIDRLLTENNKEFKSNFLKSVRDIIVLIYTTINLFLYHDVSVNIDKENSENSENAIYKKLTKYDLIKILEKESFNIYNNETDNLQKYVYNFKISNSTINEKKDKIIQIMNCLNYKINNILRLGSGQINNIYTHKYIEVVIKDNITQLQLETKYENKSLHINHIKYIVNNINYLFDTEVKEITDEKIINKIEKYIRLNNCLIYFRLFKRFYNNNIIKYSSTFKNQSNGLRMASAIFWESMFTKVYVNSYHNYALNRLVYTAQYINMFEPSQEYTNKINNSDNNNIGTAEPKKPNIKGKSFKEAARLMDNYKKELENYQKELDKRPAMSTNPPVDTSENVLFDHVEYYQKLGAEKIVNVMNQVFGKPSKPDMPRLMKPPGMPWPLPDVLGEIIAGVVNAVKMLIYFIKKFIKLVKNFNDFLKFMAKILIYFILMVFLIIYEFVGRFLITGAILFKEAIVLVIYVILGNVLAVFNLGLAIVNSFIILISGSLYYKIYVNFMANELNPRSFYLNPNYFNNIYNKYPSLNKYLVGNTFNNDSYNNDNINFGMFLLKAVNNINNGSYYINYNIDSPFFLRKKEYYLPSFFPEISIFRAYMRNMYNKMKNSGAGYDGYTLTKEIEGLNVEETSYDIRDMGEDYYNYGQEVLNHNNIKKRKKRVDEIQKNRRDYYTNWLRFKNDIKKPDNDVFKIFNIDIEKLSNYMYKNLNLEYAKDASGEQEKVYDDIDKLRDMYYNILLPYYNKHKCKKNVEHDYNKILLFHYYYYDYDKLKKNNTKFFNSNNFVTEILNQIGISKEDKVKNDERMKELYGYYKKDILRKIIMNISILLIIIGINNMIYEAL